MPQRHFQGLAVDLHCQDVAWQRRRWPKAAIATQSQDQVIVILIQGDRRFAGRIDHQPPERGMISGSDCHWSQRCLSIALMGSASDQHNQDGQNNGATNGAHCPGKIHSKLASNLSMSDWSIA